MHWKTDIRWAADGRLTDRTITTNADAALAAFRALLARDDLIGQPCAARLVSPITGTSIVFSRFNREIGDGRVHPDAPIDLAATDDISDEVTLWTPPDRPAVSSAMAMPDTGRFAADLRAWRDAHGITPRRAADLLAVSVRTVEGWERGAACGNEPTIRRLASLVTP